MKRLKELRVQGPGADVNKDIVRWAASLTIRLTLDLLGLREGVNQNKDITRLTDFAGSLTACIRSNV